MNNTWTIVTGAAGFIGSNIVRALNARGETDLLLVDDLGMDERWKNLTGLRCDEIWPVARFREALRAGSLPRRVGTVYHMGACSATTETDASYLLDNNYECSKELARYCLAHDARFVYASSAATYGDGSAGYDDSLSASGGLKPLNMYGMSKWLFDEWAIHAGCIDRFAGFKFFNVYGPGEAHKGDMRSVVHKAFGQIRREGRISLFRSYRADYADGEQKRDFVYVKDVVDVCLFFGEENREAGGLFNVGTGKARSWLDLARAVFAALEIPEQIEFIEMPESLRPKYQYFTEADVSRLRAAGYGAPFTSLEDGVADYVRNHLLQE
ncbi:MAG: ADP-glyceromanno-heptose 6-epimerase [Kiritimatiellae bacterium]|nr:ADP-glyceromanno-heptose 6-epimerase [Kiritimatiellia bacterium]